MLLRGETREHSNKARSVVHTEHMRVWGRGAESAASVLPHFPCEPGAEPSAGGSCGGLEKMLRREGRGQVMRSEQLTGYHGSVGSTHPWCGISSLGTGDGRGRAGQVLVQSWAEGRRGSAVRVLAKEWLRPGLHGLEAGGREPEVGPHGKVQGLETRMRSQGWGTEA